MVDDEEDSPMVLDQQASSDRASNRGSHGDSNSDSDSDGDSNNDSDGDSDSNSVDSNPPLLVTSREKRANAGNRMQNLLDREEEDDELTALFAEDGEEDQEFADPDVADASDEQDDSSSDDEDQGPTAGDGELEGERELISQERAEKRNKKRKAFPGSNLPFSKRVKIHRSSVKVERSTEANQVPRKSSRAGWITSIDDGSIRTSSRTLSVKNRIKTKKSVNESLIKSAQAREMNQEYQKRRREEKGRSMTQDERLAEAIRVEQVNLNSLSQWEEEENERVRKQKERQLALQNRKLQGPVMRWYSGSAEWLGDKIVHLGKKGVSEEDEANEETAGEPTGEPTKESDEDNTTERIKKPEKDLTEKATKELVEDAHVKALENPSPLATSEHVEATTEATGLSMKYPPNDDKIESVDMQDDQEIALEQSHVKVEAPTEVEGFLDGIQDYASIPEDIQREESPPDELSESFFQKPIMITPREKIAQPVEQTADVNMTTELTSPPATSVVDVQADTEPVQSENASATTPITPEVVSASHQVSTVEDQHPPSPPMTISVQDQSPQFSARQLVSLQNFDSSVQKDIDLQRRILFGWLPHQIPITHRTYKKTPKEPKDGKDLKDGKHVLSQNETEVPTGETTVEKVTNPEESKDVERFRETEKPKVSQGSDGVLVPEVVENDKAIKDPEDNEAPTNNRQPEELETKQSSEQAPLHEPKIEASLRPTIDAGGALEPVNPDIKPVNLVITPTQPAKPVSQSKPPKPPKAPKENHAEKPAKDPKSTSGPQRTLCTLTALPARYRDPVSGLPYRGVEEFKALRALLGQGKGQGMTLGQRLGLGHGHGRAQGKGQWSSLVGAWVGSGAAKGVPEGFELAEGGDGDVEVAP